MGLRPPDLTEGMELLMLAGPTPALSELPELASKHLGAVEAVLKVSARPAGAAAPPGSPASAAAQD